MFSLTHTCFLYFSQGGFCGSPDTYVEIGQEGNSKWEELEPWHLEDVGTVQSLSLQQPTVLSKLRINFQNSTDFYGRIIMYKLDVLGHKA